MKQSKDKNMLVKWLLVINLQQKQLQKYSVYNSFNLSLHFFFSNI